MPDYRQLEVQTITLQPLLSVFNIILQFILLSNFLWKKIWLHIPWESLCLNRQEMLDVGRAWEDALQVDPASLDVDPDVEEGVDPVQLLLPRQGFLFKHLHRDGMNENLNICIYSKTTHYSSCYALLFGCAETETAKFETCKTCGTCYWRDPIVPTLLHIH